jgi:predicted nucleotidyltransferase component of viral defense system
MKDFLRDIVRQAPTPDVGRSLAREYLQARILGALQHAGAMIPLAFHGGTALRFLYAIPRYSEDLDFALEGNREDYDFRNYLRVIQSELSKEGYTVEIKANDAKTVHSAFVRFLGLLFELGLSAHRNEVIAVKLEVDTNPPAGAITSTTLVRRFVLLQLHHHDKASLLAGKLHAVLQRPYPKGRDVFDLMWYLSDRTWPAPNLAMLNLALAQSGWAGPKVNDANWQTVVRDKIRTLPWREVVNDVRPFLEKSEDVGMLTVDNLAGLLS